MAMPPFEGGSPSTSSPPGPPHDGGFKQNATLEEKLQHLAALVPKAENAKNRVSDIHVKATESIGKCNKFSMSLRNVYSYAQQFYAGMNPQFDTLHRLIHSLSLRKPKLLTLQERLASEKSKLDEFTKMLARLRTIQVHPALKDYLLPELPPSERSGTLADWANASELLETHAMLDEDVEQMKDLANWGNRHHARLVEKHGIILKEKSDASDLLNQLASIDVDAYQLELTQLQRTADMVLADCTNYLSRVSDAHKMRDVLGLPTFIASDQNLPSQMISITKCRTRVNAILAELEDSATRGQKLVAMLQALGNATLEMIEECQKMDNEFKQMEADIDGYMAPTNLEVTRYTDLKQSVDAWGEFIKTYEAMVVEIDRRHQTQQRHRDVAVAYQKELQALFESESQARQEFDRMLLSAKIPPSWASLEFMTEPPIYYVVTPDRKVSVLPNLSDTSEPTEPRHAPGVQAASPSNSLLGSNFSLSESVLDDSHVFHSAIDPQLQNTPGHLGRIRPH